MIQISIELKGLNSLYKKLDGLSNLHVKEAIKSVEEEATRQIKEGASFAPKAAQHISKVAVREGEHYYYMDIGLSTKTADFDQYKEAYFHNFGYQDKGLNFGNNGPYLDMHKQWFNKSVNALSKSAKKKIKAMLEAEIKKGCR